MPPIVTPAGRRRGVGTLGVVVVVVVVVVVIVGSVLVVVPTVVVEVVVVVAPVVVVPASGTGPPANAYAARTPATAQATRKETLRPRFMCVLVSVVELRFGVLGRRGIPANPAGS